MTSNMPEQTNSGGGWEKRGGYASAPKPQKGKAPTPAAFTQKVPKNTQTSANPRPAKS